MLRTMTDVDVQRFLMEQGYYVRAIVKGDFKATALYDYLEVSMDCKVVSA
jgi:hypothetical protein